ncbi:MAG: glycosyltransferase [Chitinophagaceae bacterium]|nr:glycosyltransferase [Chitinophagaceae bacterium]
MWILISFFVCYALLVLWCCYAWCRIPVYHGETIKSAIPISIIIPARNEEENISHLLEAIEEQSYSSALIEVIVVDDQSTDQTAAIVSSFPYVKLLRLSSDIQQSHKKRAIEFGIANASHEWILTTDADCIPPVNWVAQIAAFAAEKIRC